MKILYIISLVVTIVFGVVVVKYAQDYDRVQWQGFFDSLNSYDYSYSYFDDSSYELDAITMEGATISLIFLAFYILLFSFTLKSIKRTTAKVMSIIGLCISGIGFLFTFLPLTDPGGVSFNEFAGFYIIIQLIMLAFCIVNLVQAVRNDKVLAAKAGENVVS